MLTCPSGATIRVREPQWHIVFVDERVTAAGEMIAPGHQATPVLFFEGDSLRFSCSTCLNHEQGGCYLRETPDATASS
jgi:hypothetical protein